MADFEKIRLEAWEKYCAERGLDPKAGGSWDEAQIKDWAQFFAPYAGAELVRLNGGKDNFICGVEQPRPENATTARDFRQKIYQKGIVFDRDGIFEVLYWSNKEQCYLTKWFSVLEEAQAFIENRDVPNS